MDIFSDIQLLRDNFSKCVKGYHLINSSPIKETIWEDINSQVLIASDCSIDSQSNGSHRSGADIFCNIGALSNKSTQYDAGNHSFKLSSYRLTTVCSDKIPGAIEDILTEINNRKNFAYYSIIVRNESETEYKYDWYLIPSDLPQLNPNAYEWHPKIGKIGKNKGINIGWETNTIEGSSMAITFSMSSQLWIDVLITEEIKKYIVGSCNANKETRINYMQLYDNFGDINLNLP